METETKTKTETDSTLPIDHLKYYLLHKESDALIHPFCGSDNPVNDQNLVYYKSAGRLALQFVFKNNQIMHYSSGKYIHPKDTFADKDGQALVLYDGCYDYTKIKMVKKEGRTYLQNYAGLYVHPLHGSIDVKNNTQLVYFRSYRPGISIVAVPVDNNLKFIKMEMDQKELDSLPGDTIIAETTAVNTTDVEQRVMTTLEYSRTVSNTFSLEFSLGLAFSISETVDVSVILAKSSTSLSFNLEAGMKISTSTTTTTGVKSSISTDVIVKPNSSSNVKVITQRLKGKVPFTMTLETQEGETITQKGSMDTEYFFNQKVLFG